MNEKASLTILGVPVIQLVIAVIVIAIILYFSASLAYGYHNKTNLDKASESLKLITAKVNYIGGTNATQDIVSFFPPSKWYFRSFIGSSPPGSECSPSKKSCLCICSDFRCFETLKACINSDYSVESLGNQFDSRESQSFKIIEDNDKIKLSYIADTNPSNNPEQVNPYSDTRIKA